MLKYNINKLLRLKGIAKPGVFLIKAGFGKNLTYSILQERKRYFTPSQIEKFCILFGCSPNDLMEWTPDEKHNLSEDHPLKKLQPSEMIADIRNIPKDIPLYKLEEFTKKVEELKKEMMK